MSPVEAFQGWLNQSQDISNNNSHDIHLMALGKIMKINSFRYLS